MQIHEPLILNVDIKRKNYTREFQITSNDSNTFLINITDDKIPVDLSNVLVATMAHTRMDKVTIVTQGEIIGNQVSFELGTNETSVPGRVDAVVQLYGTDTRISSVSFSYKVDADPTGKGYIPSESEQTLIELVLHDAPVILEEVKQATLDVIEATDYALDVVDSNINVPLLPVANFAAIATTYPTPLQGSKVQTTDNGKIYRWDGTEWKYIEIMNSNILTDLQVGLNKVKVRRRQVFTSTANQTVFTLTHPYTPNENSIDVSVGGVPQYSPSNFIETSSTKFTLSSSVPAGLQVIATYYGS